MRAAEIVAAIVCLCERLLEESKAATARENYGRKR
jgi:hypothetical protein